MTDKLKVWLSDKATLKISVGLFITLSVWWAILFFYYRTELAYPNLIWAASYQSIAIWGAIWGLVVAKRWGGLKSVMGRATAFFALGLLFQTFGQSVFSFYGLSGIDEVPYPSLADIGFFGSIPFYTYAVLQLSKASGVSVSIRSFNNKIQAIALPLILLIISYWYFLRGYEFDWQYPIRIFLDFGYPLGQAIYVSLAILAYLLSRNFLGGVMKNKVLFILAALTVQYLADFNFLYQFANETWVNGGYGDYLYMLAYSLMTFGLIQLGTTLRKIKEA